MPERKRVYNEAIPERSGKFFAEQLNFLMRSDIQKDDAYFKRINLRFRTPIVVKTGFFTTSVNQSILNVMRWTSGTGSQNAFRYDLSLSQEDQPQQTPFERWSGIPEPRPIQILIFKSRLQMIDGIWTFNHTKTVYLPTPAIWINIISETQRARIVYPDSFTGYMA